MSKRSHSHNDLAAAFARARAARGLPNASDEVDLVCPHCGYQGPESEFDEVETPDGDGDAEDSYKTDPVTTETGNKDSDNVGDRPAEYDNRRITHLNNLARDLAKASTNKGNK